MQKLISRLIVVVAFVCAYLPPAQAQVEIDIVRGLGTRTPVAVVPFGWKGDGSKAPFDISALIAADLQRSGRFAPIAADRMLQQPTSGEGVDFDDWTVLKVEAVVVGTIEQEGPNAFKVRFQLFDPFSRKQLLGYQMPSSEGTMRAVGHRAADMIYEKLTGIPGVFGTKVTYVTSKGTGKQQVFNLIVSDIDGENDHVIMESSDPIMSPAWSPDSRRLAYVSFEKHRSTIYVQTLRTGSRISVSSRPGINGSPAFSPDGRKLVMTLGGADGNLDINVLDLATREVKRLTTHNAIDTEGSWSPDGREIYFTSDRSGGPQVYKISANGGNAERVTFEGGYNARPRLSPDGQKLALVHLDRGNYRIAVLNLKTRGLIVVSAGSQDESPSFAPNSDSLIYATRQGRSGVLETVSADGLVRQRLGSAQGDVREPVWSPFPRF